MTPGAVMLYTPLICKQNKYLFLLKLKLSSDNQSQWKVSSD